MSHTVGNGHVKPDPTKLQAVKQVILTRCEGGHFLGQTGYYRRLHSSTFVRFDKEEIARESVIDIKFFERRAVSIIE